MLLIKDVVCFVLNSHFLFIVIFFDNFDVLITAT